MWRGQRRGRRHGGTTVGSSSELPIFGYGVLGVTLSGRKWRGTGGRPHLGIVGHGEVATCSCDNELLRCSSALGVGGEGQGRSRGLRWCFSSRRRSLGDFNLAWRWRQIPRRTAAGLELQGVGHQGSFYRGNLRCAEQGLLKPNPSRFDPLFEGFAWICKRGKSWFGSDLG
jgi:hypothetical protein